MLVAAGKELGLQGMVQLAGCGEDLFTMAMITSINGSSGRAKRHLGWESKKQFLCRGWMFMQMRG